MRKMKKIASLMMALVMVMAMSVTAFAADNYTISLADTSSGYTYVVYQIFTGDLYEDVLSNVAFGSALDEADQTALLAAYNVSDVTALAGAIDDAQALADELAKTTYTLESCGTLSDEARTLTVQAGYYLIVNTVVPEGDNGYSDYIVNIANNLTITPKSNTTPDFDKTVGTETTNDATAEYAVGDTVPFTLTATLATSYTAYDAYKLVFTDTLSSGLTFDNTSLEVTVVNADGNTLGTLENETDYKLSTSTNADNETVVTVTISDLKTACEKAVAGCKVVVSYSATLNENAGNEESNGATLTFSNNPNGTETGTTEEDKVYVITFDITVNKVDGEDAPLQGAAFTLYKYDEESETYEETGTVLTVGEDKTSFTIDGLAVGTYKLVETTTPSGYNTAADIVFTISADPVETSTGVDVNGSVNNASLTLTTSSLTTTVVNESGASLPSTGGIGTTIFYVVGTVLVLGAAVVLITRRRMSSEA